MGHATHFLQRLERIEGPALDLALGLYRDPPLLRWALDRMAVPDVARVAVPLESGPEPPHAIVTRQGDFVTCLGPGMRTGDAHPISHSKLQMAVGEVEAWRDMVARTEHQSRLAVDRLMTVGTWFSREDFEELVICSAIVPNAFPSLVGRLKLSLEKYERDFTSRTYRRLDDTAKTALALYWKHAWAMSHAAVVATETGVRIDAYQPRSIDPEELAYMVCEPVGRRLQGSTLRSMWCLGRLGKLLSPTLRGWLRLEGRERRMAILGLTAAGLRQVGLRAEATKALTRMVPEALRREFDQTTTLEQVVDLALAAIRSAGVNAGLAVRGLGALRDPEAAAQEASSEIVAQFAMPLASLIEREDTGAPEDPVQLMHWSFSMAAILSESSLIRPGSQLRHIVASLPAIAQRPASDLFLPRAVLQRLTEYKGMTPESIREHLAAMQQGLGVHTPVTVEKTPGRNDPCTCGSGRKYKVCCGK